MRRHQDQREGGATLTIKNATLKWGKFHQEGQTDTEISADDVSKITIPSGETRTISSCGRASAASGTEGSFDVYDGATKVGTYYWDCPLCMPAVGLVRQVFAWDSRKTNPTHPTHSYLTEWAIDQLEVGLPEVQSFRDQLVEGANQELHELKTSGSLYGVDLEAKREQHKGTNEGSDDIQGWWDEARSAYRAGDKAKAYFLLGIMLHMGEDMGVPAHANHVHHQGNATEFDNFEFMALSNWKPKFDDINRTDPGFAEPWKYYGESQNWTHADAPNYNNPNTFSKTRAFASAQERALLSNRQGRTCNVAMWALRAGAKAFASRSVTALRSDPPRNDTGRHFPMFRKLSYTWELMGASWRVLEEDKELLLFPLLSGICCLLVMASFAFPAWYTDAWQRPRGDDSWQHQSLYYGVLFLFYLCTYFVITFFNTAIIAGAIERMSGGDPTFGSCPNAATSRLPLIFGWALVSATVGLILRFVEDRSKSGAAFGAKLLGMAWTLASFLAVPILVAERKSPIDAVKGSAALLKKTWGEQLVGNFSFGFVFFLLGIPAFVAIALAVYAESALKSMPLAVASATVGVLYLILLALIQSALHSIFQAALYLHARTELDQSHYPDALLSDALGHRGR